MTTTMGDGHWECLAATPNVFYLPASPNVAPCDEDSTAICHGDDFLAEGYDEQLDALDELLKQQFEVTASARFDQEKLDRQHTSREGSAIQTSCQVATSQVSFGLPMPSMWTS